MNSLIIGDTSQLSYYFPLEYERISSRNINFDDYKNKKYDRVFVCFSEQRTFLEDDKIFYDINVDYTISVIDFFKDICNKLVVYGTSELWNKCSGPIDVFVPFDYFNTPYIDSKRKMVDKIKELNFSNVIIIHPFNFNSIYRKEGFLFWKIFDSIINDKKIEIGDTYFYRDLIHPKYIVEQSINSEEDLIVGSGRLMFVNDFIRDLYFGMRMEYDYFVTENVKYDLNIKRNINYSNNYICSYEKIIENTIDELKERKNIISKGHN